MPRRDSTTSQWTAGGVAGFAATAAYMVSLGGGIAELSDTGPASAVWIATGSSGVVALSATGTAAGYLVRDGTVATLYA